jgi:HPt (histidine-containing phosphotransfer) domain-containing protein
MAGMTPSLWAGTDPVNGVPRPPDPAVSGVREAAPEGTAEAPTSWSDLDGAIRSIGEHALKMNLARARDLEVALTLVAAGQLDDARRISAIAAAHQLVGSAGTFGFPGASDLAAELERFFVRAVFDEPHQTVAAAQLSALFAELATEPDY